MKTLIAIWIAAGLLLAACAGDNQTKATNSLAIACETMATTLEQLAPRRSVLSADAVSKINTAKGVTDNVCLPGSPFDPAVAVSVVQNAIAILKGI